MSTLTEVTGANPGRWGVATLQILGRGRGGRRGVVGSWTGREILL